MIVHTDEGIAMATMARTDGAGADVVYELVGAPTLGELRRCRDPGPGRLHRLPRWHPGPD